MNVGEPHTALERVYPHRSARSCICVFGEETKGQEKRVPTVSKAFTVGWCFFNSVLRSAASVFPWVQNAYSWALTPALKNLNF